MLMRLTTPAMSGVVALLLALALSGAAAGVALVADTAPAETEVTAPEAVDTTATFEDTDGDGVDDDCQEAVEPNVEAEASAAAAVDLDKDGAISTSEAARSDRVGGKNCNHGGYVSGVAKSDDEDEDEDEDTAEKEAADCEAVVEPAEPVDEDAAAAEDEEAAPNAHGKAVSDVAKSNAVGGKNCNHGGAVSEAAKGDHGSKPDKADKAAAKADKAAAKAERAAARAERAAAKANR